MHAPSPALLAWLLTCPAAPVCDGAFVILLSTLSMPYAVAASVMSCLQHICAPLPMCLSSGATASCQHVLTCLCRADTELQLGWCMMRLRGAGIIVSGTSAPGLRQQKQIASSELGRELQKARHDPKVKAVVLRVDSPGWQPSFTPCL